MKSFVFIAVTFFATIQALKIVDLEVQVQWKTFKSTYNKRYQSTAEELYRQKIFADKLHIITKHNERYEQGLESFTVGVNRFADLLPSEVNAMMPNLNLTPVKNLKQQLFVPPSNFKVPPSVDWRHKGAVTQVKDQSQCKAPWAFSATGALEGQLFIKTGKLVSLSEQNLVDCVNSTHNDIGCNKPGTPAIAFDYVKNNGGIDTEDSYESDPEGKCNYSPANSAGTDTGYKSIESGSEEQLQAAVASVGPISVGIDASQNSFFNYKGGVYDEPQCGSSLGSVNHFVLVVGYGTDDSGQDYWLVKNSWGEEFGLDGYIKMSRNKNNQCAIASIATYPTV